MNTTSPTIQYDYANQAWVIDGVYQACNHPESMDCNCYGKQHAGEKYQPCDHDHKTAYYTDDLVAMYFVCDECGLRMSEE